MTNLFKTVRWSSTERPPVGKTCIVSPVLQLLTDFYVVSDAVKCNLTGKAGRVSKHSSNVVYMKFKELGELPVTPEFLISHELTKKGREALLSLV